MAKIVKQFTKFIFPFSYDKEVVRPEKTVFLNKKGVETRVFLPCSVIPESLRDGLELLLSEEGGCTKIADCYELNIQARKRFFLPPRKEEYLDFYCRQAGADPLRVAIQEIRLYLFESSVGFVELECSYESDSLDDYLNCNYFICEAKSDKNRFVHHAKIWDEESKASRVEDVEFTVKDLLDAIFGQAAAQGGIEFTYLKAKPIIYSYLLTDEKAENHGDLLKHAAKNYKESYKFDDSCGTSGSLHPFENSYWASSLNGVTNYSYLTGNEITDTFFINNFYSKMKRTYYFLFLNVLHQRGAVSRIMGRMGSLDRLGNDYHVMKQELKLARQYEAESINLKFRAFFQCPSSVEHINQYYNMLHTTFQVGTLYDNFTADIKNLQNICNKYVERIKERDDKFKKIKSIKTEIFVSLFGMLVAEVTLINSSWALIEKLMGKSLSFWSPAILILVITVCSPLITIFINTKKQCEEIAQMKKALKEEAKEKLVEDDKKRKKRGRLLKRLSKKKEK